MKNIYTFSIKRSIGAIFTLLSLCLFSLSFVQAQAPANDLCAGAITVACGSTTAGTTINATTTGEPSSGPVCGARLIDAVGVWYHFVGTGVNTTVSLCGTRAIAGFDAQLHVFSSAACGGPYTCVGGSDDDCGPLLDPVVEFVSTLGTNYYIYVNGYFGDTGPFTMDIICTPIAVNDLCANAIPVSCGNSYVGTTLGTTTTGQPGLCVESVDATGVWYSFAGNGQLITAEICAPLFDSKMNVYTGLCGSLICVDGENDDNGSCSTEDPIISFLSLVGRTYYLYVNGAAGETGNFNLDISCQTPATNDLCANAIAVSCGNSYAGTTSGTSTTGQPGMCVESIDASGVWYSFAGNGDIITADLCGAGYNSKMNVYTGLCGSFICINGEDDDNAICNSNDPSISFASLAGRTYYFYVNGANNETGNFTLNIACSPVPTNDDCASAASITQNASCVPTSGTLFGLTTSTPAACMGTSAADAWYSFTANTVNPIIEVTAGFDAITTVYDAPCGTGAQLYCSDPNNIQTANLIVGNTYYIRIGTALGTFPVDASFTVCVVDGAPTCPVNGAVAADDCGNAPLIAGGNVICATTLSSYNATVNGIAGANSSTAFCGGLDNNSYFRFIANSSIATIRWWGGACATSSGAQFQIFSVTGGTSCNNGTWAAVSDCVADGTNPALSGTNGTMTANNLTPGNTYYVMIDGFAGDVCDYTFRVETGVVLATALGDFSGEVAGNDIALNWATLQEANNNHFGIERSVDQTSFEEIGTVKGIGNSESASQYQFMDENPIMGTNYYRLRQVDVDGSTAYSNVIAVTFIASSLTDVYPNPFSSTLGVRLNEIQRQATFKLFTLTGEVVVQKTWKTGEEGVHLLDLSGLSSGIYYYQVRNGNELISDKITKTN